MLHLFNKTYLDIDSFISMNENRIVISEIYGTPVWSVLEKTTSGELFAYGTSVEAAIGEEKRFSSYGELFELCYDKNLEHGRRVVIYADKVSYCKIASALFKMIFANIDADSGYDIIQTSFSRDILLGGREVFLLADKVVEAKPTKSEFVEAFNSVSVDVSNPSVVSAYDKIKNKLSLEYTLASYFVNPTDYKELLKPIVHNMINRFVEEATKEAYRTYQAAILSPRIRSNLGITNSYTIDNLEDMLNEPVLAALKKCNVWRAAGGKGLPREPLDLTKFSEAEIQVIKDQCVVVKHFLNTTFDVSSVEKIYSRVLSYIDILKTGVVTDQNLIDIIDFDMSGPDDDRFWSFKDRTTINEYLIEHFLLSRSNNDTLTLAPFLLRL